MGKHCNATTRAMKCGESSTILSDNITNSYNVVAHIGCLYGRTRERRYSKKKKNAKSVDKLHKTLEEFYYLLMGIQYPTTRVLITERQWRIKGIETPVCIVEDIPSQYRCLKRDRTVFSGSMTMGSSYHTNGSPRTSDNCWSTAGVANTW